ncbi:nickel-dependent lactate racemase [candidate division KSB1 bacterium]|nr:nickel-dependent lactate racemase [candidate division KSB1 bacterium]
MVELKYGRKVVSLNPPSFIRWLPLEKTIDEPPVSERALLTDAADTLISQLKELPLRRGARLLLVVPDHTRKCRLSDILPILLQRLEESFQPLVEILIANGSHVVQPESTVENLVGKEVYRRLDVVQHNALCSEDMRYVGETTAGTPIRLNRRVVEADCVVTVGGTLYHYFAGFGGGPKMLLPGVADIETIRLNHRRTIDPDTGTFHENCREGEIDNNPVYQDLVQVLRFLPRLISLQVVLDAMGRFHYAGVGPVVEIQKEAIARVRALYRIPLAEKADIVLASAGGYPADLNLIQSHKSIHHAYQVVRPGGVLVMFAECSEGIGSSTFMPYFQNGSSLDIAAALLQDYQINGHTALALRSKTESVSLYLVSMLPDSLVKEMGMLPLKADESMWQILSKGLFSEGYLFPQASLYSPECVS